MLCECKMSNSHNSLIIRKRHNQIEAPADSRKKDSFLGCLFFCDMGVVLSEYSFFCEPACASPTASLKKKLSAQFLRPTPISRHTFSLNDGLRGYLSLLLAYGCAIRYPRFDFVGRAPADSRKREGQEAFSFCVNKICYPPPHPLL